MVEVHNLRRSIMKAGLSYRKLSRKNFSSLKARESFIVTALQLKMSTIFSSSSEGAIVGELGTGLAGASGEIIF